MLTLQEQETSILFDRASDKATIYSADPAVIRRLKRLPAYTLKREDKQGGRVIAATFEADKRIVTLRSALPKKRDWTEEEKTAARNRMQAIRENQNLGIASR